MGSKSQSSRSVSSPPSSFLYFRCFPILTILSLSFTYLFLLLVPLRLFPGGPPSRPDEARFEGDLRDAGFPWNRLCFGPPSEKLKIAAFSKTWPIGAGPGGMERHAATLYRALARRGHDIHVFTAPSDRRLHGDIHEGNLHVYFAANDHGSVNCSLAFEIFNRVNADGAFDYVHSESVSLPHWRAKNVANVAVTWHGIWYEIMHSKVFQELLSDPKGILPGSVNELRESIPRLLDEIRFFPSYTQHICISKSAADVLVKIYQLPPRKVHVILNGVDESRFFPNPEAGASFREKYGVPSNATIVMGVAGRLVQDKGHPLLHEAFGLLSWRHPGLFLLVVGSGPWARRYTELGPSVRVLGPLEPSELSGFYNAIDVLVNPTLRPQGLDLTITEAMHCGKPVLAPNYPSITGTVILNEELGYTFSPNVKSFVEALETLMSDGPKKLKVKGMACKEHVVGLFTATKMASAYERFFLCMKNPQYCRYPLPSDC